MLVLSRRPGESIMVGDDVEIRVLEVRGHGDQAVVRIGIVAPQQVRVHRKEVYDAVVAANRQAVLAPEVFEKEHLGDLLAAKNREHDPQDKPQDR